VSAAGDVAAPLPGSFTAWRRSLQERVAQGDVGMLPVVLGLVLIWSVFQFLNPNFLSPRNISNLLVQIADIGTISVGIVLVLLLGEIDLSVGSVSGLAASVMAVLNIKRGVPAPLAISAGIAAGALIGFIQGSWFARFRIPSFVVTLAGLLGWLGVQLLVLGETGTLNLLNPTIENLAGNYLSPQAGWALAVVILAVVAFDAFLVRRRRAAAGLDLPPPAGVAARLAITAVLVLGTAFVLNSYLGIPEALLILLGFVVLFDLLTKRTTFGRHIYAVGGNAEAARRAGINVPRIRILVFMISGLMSGLGGIVLAARLNSVDLNAGGGTLLIDAIAAAVIGGTSLFGGRGEVRDALIGATLISTVSNGMFILGYGTGIIFMVTGAILLLAVTFDTVVRRLQVRSGR